MQFLELPEEILIIIIRKLDVQSQQSMYNSCSTIRNVVCMHAVIKDCKMSMNVLATANTLKLNFFKDISRHLLVLNMCGVPDLSKTKVLPAFKMLKKLITLDISYTNLNLLDLVDIHNVCPTIKNIHVNFAFGPPATVKLSKETIMQVQDLFEHFDNVFFVGSIISLLYSKLVLRILSKTNLNRLVFSITETKGSFATSGESQEQYIMPPLNQLSVYLVNWKSINTSYSFIAEFPVLSIIEYKRYEFIIMYMLNMFSISIFTTPIFKEFFNDNFNVDVECVTEYNCNLVGNVAILLWNKETTTFDNIFFQKLYRHVKQYFPFVYDPETEMPSVKKYDWFGIVPRAPNELIKHKDAYKYESKIKKRRIAMPNYVLNYDEIFKEKYKAQLSLVFNTHITASVALTPNCNYLSKLTFLSLCGQVSYSSDFFNILFRCCDKLLTINVEAPVISPCAASISRSIPLSRTLKNIRMVDKRIDFKTIFSSFSQCPTLENIHVIDQRQWEHSQITDPNILFEKCVNLFSVYIQAPLSESAQVNQLRIFNNAKILFNKFHVNVVVNHVTGNNSVKHNYDPFLEVFQLHPIKPI